ncbi:unnamed protein product, partial [Heterotrigona itama]
SLLLEILTDIFWIRTVEAFDNSCDEDFYLKFCKEKESIFMVCPMCDLTLLSGFCRACLIGTIDNFENSV